MSQTLDLTSILVQVPLVAAFIWFALRLNADHQKTLDKIVGDNRAANMSVMQDWRNYLKERDGQWLQFLLEQRNSQNATLDVFAERIADLSHAVSDLDKHVRSKQA